MQLIVTIDCDNEAFRGADCGSELVHLFESYANDLEFVSQDDILNVYSPKPAPIFDRNGNRVGSFIVIA